MNFRSAAILLAPIGLLGQVRDQESGFVYPLPGPADFVQRSNIVYQQKGEAKLVLDLFLPAHPPGSKPMPVFMVYNGFGGSFMRTSPQAQSWAKAATSHGFAAITADTTESKTDADFDVLTDHLKRHSEEWHIDPNSLVVMAWSGNVSDALPTIEGPQRKAIKAAVIYYGSAQVTEFRRDLPILLVRAGLDQPGTNRSMDRTVAAGIAANAPWTLLNYPAGRHGFDMLDDNDLSREIIEETFRFAKLAISSAHQSAVSAGLAEAEASGAMFMGNFERASALYWGLVAAHPQDARLLLAHGIALSGAKRYREARTEFNRAKEIGGLGPRDLGLPAAQACLLDHDPDAAMVWLKAIPARGLPVSLRTDPAFASLTGRADFRHYSILARISL